MLSASCPINLRPYGLGLIIVALTATVFAVLGWQVPMVAVCVSGLPVLFAAYLRQAGVREVLPCRPLAVAMALAAGLGIGWAHIAGPITANAYLAALGGRMDATQLLLCGVAIPISYGLVLLAPAGLVRVLHRTGGAPETGFAVGAAGALTVNAAATVTLLTPQLTTGLTATSQPVENLLAEAFVEGFAWPLVSAAVGGLFGIALWGNDNRVAPQRCRWPLTVPTALLAAIAFSVAMGVADVAPLPLSPYVTLQLLISTVSIVVARSAVANSMRYESQTPRIAPQRTATYRGVLGVVIAGLGAAVAVVVAAAVAVRPPAPAYACPPDCGGPPIGKPVETNPRYSADNGAFSVAYPGEGTAYEVTFDPPGINGVQLRYLGGDTGTMTLFGKPASGRTAKQLALEVLRRNYPAASVSYEIPNASVGYEPGYGVVADVYRRDTSSTYTRLRVIVMVAVRHDYGLIATAAGPYHEFSPDYGPGHPSGANLEVAMDMGKYVNSFRWYGDRYTRTS